ncbi:MAG: pyrroline-5-carboxylate reductase, partial [Candidatus Sumerlaeia bacterium]|nr:pyrroline-5-carboxylate reductase [Candidatus Sumerlaeia bacterium]
MSSSIKIGVIGTGNMGSAIIAGLVTKDIVLPKNIYAFDIDKERLKKISQDFGLSICRSNIELLNLAEVIILAVKPQNMRELLREIKPAVTSRHCFLSVVAGIRTDSIASIGDNVRVVRIMSNTPALIGAGATAIAGGKYALPQDLQLARTIFSALGLVIEVEEEQLDAITALSGSGPAYFFYLVECLIEAGKKAGLTEDVAEKLARQTAFGAGKLMIESTDTPQTLRLKVTSPGGTTAAALE